jgi:hypothetical protein
MIKKLKHGSPEDRGQADYYYGRPWNPHCWKHFGFKLIRHEKMTEEEVNQYTKGYRDQSAGQKDWSQSGLGCGEDVLSSAPISEEGREFNKEYDAIMEDVHEQITKKNE